MYGIENLKKVIKVACDFTKQAATSLMDGWQWTDFFAFVDEMAEIPGAVKSLGSVMQELKDLSNEERDELYAYLVQEFDIPNDKVESFVEDAVIWATSTVSLIERFKGLKSAA